MSDPQIYNEGQARQFVGLAMRNNRCAELLNALANGGMVSLQQDPNTGWQLVIIDGETTARFMEELGAGQ